MNAHELPKTITNETELDRFIAEPPDRVIQLMARLEGDIMVLGIAGKMGVNLGMMAVNAVKAAGLKKRVIGVSRFSDAGAREKVESAGVEAMTCDLLDRDAVAELPQTKNIIFMAGKKFGTDGAEDATWAMNTVVPANVCHHFRGSRIVAYSTGCVYEFVTPESGGSVETDTPKPVGDYAQSALGRERVFSYYSKVFGTPTCLVRLNYAIDLRYGVLYDIGSKVFSGEPVDLTTGFVNVIWQGDAIAQSLFCFDQCASPAAIVNVTGSEIIPVRLLAEELAKRMGKAPRFCGAESSTAYLNNASKAFGLFGRPRVPLAAMLDWTAHWIASGGRSLGKPTHFETKTGRY